LWHPSQTARGPRGKVGLLDRTGGAGMTTTMRRLDRVEAPTYAPPADTGPRAVAAGWMINATFLLGLMLACSA
jgi:hypothetical protein